LTAPLDGLVVLIPESRELDLFAAMLEQEGASTLRCPLVRIVPLDDTRDAQAWIARCIAGQFDDLVLMTGDGLRHLLKIAGPNRPAFLSAIAKMRKIVRGPKPARALREVSLLPDVSAPQPTSDGVLAVFAPENLAGRKIALQLYPGAAELAEKLRARGATVDTVIPYAYASHADSAAVREAITALTEGRIGLVAFTSSPQIERLFAVAKESGEEEALQRALLKTPIAAIGPVVEEALQRHGLKAALAPDANFHLKPLVRAIVAWATP
jgi:uroporphyrinogen-III synthase